MCRSSGQGGRRCPGHSSRARSSAQRAVQRAAAELRAATYAQDPDRITKAEQRAAEAADRLNRVNTDRPGGTTPPPADTGHGRDGGVGPVTGEGNLTISDPQGPLHISTAGGTPHVVGDVPSTSPHPDSQRRRNTDRDRGRDRMRAARDAARHAQRAHRQDTGTVNVVGNGRITITGAVNVRATRKAQRHNNDSDTGQ